MRLSEIVRSAIKALSSNKLRTFLTMLGVVIGVFAVVSLVSLVKGVENYIVDSFNALGSNLILVAPGRTNFNQDPAVSFSNNKLQEKHAELIEKEAGEYLVAVTPNLRFSKTVTYKDRKYYATIVGVNEKALSLVNYTVSQGDFFTKGDVDSKQKVAFIGFDVKDKLFHAEDPINHKIKIGDITFNIIGVAEKKGGDEDSRIIIPFSTAKNAFDIKILSGITTKAKDANQIDFAMKQVEISLLKDLDTDEFTVLSQQDILKSIQNILNILSIGLGAIAAISLIVGGIGIMNIMLVSVTERTQEIGLRKALGATSRLIGMQFLVESIFVSVFGGVIGLFFGWFVTFITQSFLRSQVPWWAVVVGIGFSVLVGTVFGTYPALQASKKDPIESLRYE